jgi:hypothetical protein
MRKKATDSKDSADESYAYTPGLKVKRASVVRKTRRLPIPGEILVNEGDTVDFDTIVARTKIPGEPNVMKVDEILNVSPEDVPAFMVKKVGDAVERDEVIAKYTPFFGLIKKFARSSMAGTIESISDSSGQVVIRAPPIPVEIKAYVRGTVTKTIPRGGVIIEADAAFIQGIFGISGERHGKLAVVAVSPDDVLTADKISSDQKGKILVGGSLVTNDALKRAVDSGVAGVVTGGIDGGGLSQFLGYEMGVAITGEEEIGLTLIITEGFGKMRMSDRTFQLLKEFDGYEAAINGATQIRAGVLRPEIIIPHKSAHSKAEERELARGMVPGTPVRIIGDPYFGKIGTVLVLPVQLKKVETGSDVRVVDVKLEGGEVATVPRANVEIIEE